MLPPEKGVRCVALTGASGFIGSRLVDRLASSGHIVRVLYHRHKPPEHPNVVAIHGALDDLSSLAVLVQGADTVVHCGGVVAVRHQRDFDRVNVRGTASLAAVAERQKVQRFLLISSLAARLPAISPYASSKRGGENALAEHTAMAWDIIRPPAVYGPGDKQILTLLKALAAGIGFLPAGRDARVSIIHVDDLADAIACWIDAGKATHSTFEIDDGQAGGHRWQDILGAAAQIMAVQPRYVVPPAGLLKLYSFLMKNAALLVGKTPFLTPDKVRELRYPQWICDNNGDFTGQTGWKPKISLFMGMESTLGWYRAEGLLK